MATCIVILNDYSNIIIPAFVIAVFALVFIYLLVSNRKRIFFDQRQNVSTSIIIIVSAIVPVYSVVTLFVKNDPANATQIALITNNYLIIATGCMLALIMRLLWHAEDRDKQENLTTDAHWNSDEVWKIIRTAKYQITLYQTWFPDAAIVADRLANIFDYPENKVEIIIYQLHPDAKVGGDRFLAINSNRLKAKSDQDKLIARKAFFCQSVASIDNLIQRFEKTKYVSVKIYIYDEYTDWRVYKIDETILCSEYKSGVSSTKSKPEIIWEKDRKKKDKQDDFEKCETVINTVNGGIKVEEPYYVKLPRNTGILKGDLYESELF